MRQPKISSANFSFLYLLIFLILTYLAILVNVPVLRQLLGFCFLAFAPGMLILHILRLNQLGLTEKVVLSVGLSTAFLMFVGLLINTVEFLFHYSTPLALNSLLISFGIITVALVIFAYFRNHTVPFFHLSDLSLSWREKSFLLAPSLFLLLSIWGMRIMDTTSNNTLLMVLLLLIPVYSIVIIIMRRQFPERIYPPVILLIGLSVLLLETLRSPYLIGSDTHNEYYLFQLVSTNAHWQIYGAGTLDSCLSISLLPAIYQSFLNMNAEFLFKALYPLIFSVAPLVVYIISRKYISSSYAFLAALFFISQFTFVDTAGGARCSLAFLFFALAMMILFSSNLSEFSKRLLFILFTASCIVSHYSTTYIFLLALLFTWLGMKIILRIFLRQRKTPALSGNITTGTKASEPAAPRAPMMKNQITLITVAIFFVLLFFWYSDVTLAAFSAGVSFFREVFVNLNLSFVMELKGATITASLGENIRSIPQILRVVFSWLGVTFIAIGVLSTLARYRKMVTTPWLGQEKPPFLISKFEMEYMVLALVCSAILVSAFILPWISVGYSMERVHFQTLSVLSVFFVIGGITVAGWTRTKTSIVILTVIIPLFMCVTGTMYQLFNVPASILLNSTGREYQFWYVHDQDRYAARWLGEYRGAGEYVYTGDWPGPRVVVSQGGISPNDVLGMFSNRYEKGEEIAGYIYLRYNDINVERLPEKYHDMLGSRNKLYVSNGAEVYR